MISSDETIAKFCACFGLTISETQKRQKPDETICVEMGLNVPAFKKMLIKNDMEEYTDILLLYWLMQRTFALKSAKSNIQPFDIAMRISSEYSKDLTETLIFLLDDKSGKNTSITFQKSRNSITIRNKQIFEVITSALLNEFKNRNMNSEELTFEEAKEEIYHQYDKGWIDDYLQEMVRLNHHLFSYDFDDNISEYNFEEAFEHFNDDLMVERYASEHYTSREITLEFLKSKLGVLIPQTKKKVGAKPKNNHIAVIARRLSYLKRIDRFIENINAIDIDAIKLTNKDHRFIHDFLAFLKLIEDYSIKENTTTTPEKYIYTLLKQTTPDELKYSNVKSRIIETRNKLHEQSM